LSCVLPVEGAEAVGLSLRRMCRIYVEVARCGTLRDELAWRPHRQTFQALTYKIITPEHGRSPQRDRGQPPVNCLVSRRT